MDNRTEEEKEEELKIKKKEVRAPSSDTIKQTVQTDFQDLENRYHDVALTCLKFFPAKLESGDYHLNMDTHAYFKFMVAFKKCYPVWCMQTQTAIDNGYIEGWAPFYDWSLKKPTRRVKKYMDRAPYHLGALLQLNSCTKDEMAEVLRALGKKEINVNLHAKDGEGGDVYMNYEVPKEGYTWPRGAPSRKWFP